MTNTSDFNKNKENEKHNYINFVKNWYESTYSNKPHIKEVNYNNEKVIENIVTLSCLNELNEFQKFLFCNNDRIKFSCNYTEIAVNIFSLPDNIAIGHCVSQCLTMSQGIALQFRNKFNNVKKLIDQEKKTTEVAYLINKNQWILYLITKERFNDKPTYSDIFSTLINTKQFCVDNKITTLALPKICTGLDKKQWNVISNMIKFIFQNSVINIIICCKPENDKQIINLKNDDSQITNITLGKNFDDEINDKLKNDIIHTAGSFIKSENVLSDGDCGAHALRICLKQHGIYRKTIEILNMLNVPNCKSGYYLKDNDLAYICDQFNMNLYIIYETNDYTNAIIYWKPNRKNIGIFHKDLHWTPGIITKTDYPRKFNNSTINTVFPDYQTIEKHIDHFLYESFDRLKISQQNPIVKNNTDYNINNKATDKSTVWYSQYCQDCEMLSTSQNSLDRLENIKDENPFWSEGGDIMFCEICGNYVRQYRNRPMQNDELTLNNNKYRTEHKNMTEIEINNNNNINNNNQHSDMERKQRVLSIKIEVDDIERYAIIDTGSNISCIDYSLVNNISQIKSKENIKITGADNSELEQLGKIDFKIKINKVTYIIDAFVIKGLSCKILLGNDFHIKNNLIINFEDKYLTLNNDIILMDEVWYNYNNTIYNINVKSDFIENKSCSNIQKKTFNKIISNENITIAPKSRSELKVVSKLQDKQIRSITIKPTERLYSNKYVTLETRLLKSDDKVILYNFSNTYCNIPKNMVIATATELKTKIYNKYEIKNINSADTKNIDNKKTIVTEITDKQGSIVKISNELSYEQRLKATQLINKFKHLFTSDPLDIGCANVEPCEIKLKSDKPIFQPPYRTPPKQREQLKKLINEMIEADIVEPSRSNYAAPVFLIPKKEKGEYRFLVDYRKLNNETINDKHPIPRSQDLFRSLEGAKYYTCLDLAQGYFQLPIKKEDQYKTAFITDFGLYNFKRIPQGFKNSGPIFQRVINNIFSDYLYRTMIAYLDDICCFGNTFEEALTRLEEIFIRLEEAGLKLKTNKCTILGSEIELLGHKVSNLGIKPLEKNIKAITQFPIPTKVKDVRAFIGLTSYYRKYIKNFAKIACPLTDLTKKDNKFHWDKSQDIAFNTLKNAIITAPVLAHFEDEYPVFVTTDASLEGLSGILEQSDNKGKRHPIAYASRKLKGGEKNFTTTELEMSAVVFAVNYFKEYLLGRKVTVFSDHSSLQYYQTMKNPSSRITKFIFKLLEFDLEIKHHPGLCNQAADCLSRYPVDTLLAKDILEVNNKEDLNFDSINLEKLKENQSKDEFCKGIMFAINGNNNSKFKRKSRQFLIKNDMLFFKNWSPNGIENLLVVPKTLVNLVLKSYHESVLSAHFGVTKTLAKLRKKYYWPTMIQDTNEFIKTCVSCQLSKMSYGKKPGLLQPIPLIDTKPISRLCFDYLGPLPISQGKKYLIVATCNATKMAFAKAVKNADAAATISFLLDIITTYGTPKYFVSDRGTHFKNSEVQKICKKLGITQIFSTSYHPQSNGMTELMNKIICNCLTHYVDNNQKKWSLYYKMVVFAYNTYPHARLGHSPYYLMFGAEANQPLDNKICPPDTSYNRLEAIEQLQKIREELPELIKIEQDKQKKNYDKSHKTVSYSPGQLVLIDTKSQKFGEIKKLAHKFNGPFKIIEKISDVNYKIELILRGKPTVDIIHVNRMKPYHER